MSEQIDQFFRPDGTLISIPVKPAKKIAVLQHIASELSPDTKYPEKRCDNWIKFILTNGQAISLGLPFILGTPSIRLR